MSKLGELVNLLIPPPQYARDKDEISFYAPARKNYRKEYRKHARYGAAYKFAIGLLAISIVENLQPRPAPIPIRLLSSETSTTQTQKGKPASLHPESSQTVPSILFDHARSEPKILWTSSTNKATSRKPR